MNRLAGMVGIVVALTLALSGCKTPQPALDQANNGAALTVSLASEIRAFRGSHAKIAKARLDSVRRLRVSLANYEVEGNFDERLLKATDKTEALKLYSVLKELSDSRAQDESQLQSKIVAMDATFAKLLDPLPDATKDLAATQNALASLGKELSTRERIATTAAFVKGIRSTVEENREKIKAAEKEAIPAPMQPDKPTDLP